MKQQELIPHLFRTEYSKIVAVLCKLLGFEHIDVAEDIASETFLSAVETWPYKGLPENPAAWLYTVAKNKAKNHVKRNSIFSTKVAAALQQATFTAEETEPDLSEENITDSQLRMLFVVCHPSIPVEAQIGLALRVLCGFGIDEIANALLTNKETINKRLYRAKERLRQEQLNIGEPCDIETGSRMANVLTTLYLLFNEGYYSESADTVLREDLCLEAMRLAYLLTKNESTNLPEVSALLSMMCFHASRFAARKSGNGQAILYNEQDDTLWDKELIAKGAYLLHKASKGNELSRYHLEAGIAYWHTQKADTIEKWENILQLFNQLLRLEYSPIVALNRTYALAKVKGKEVAIGEAEKLKLTDNTYYFTLLGELYSGIDNDKAEEHFRTAYGLAKTDGDRQVILKRINR